MLPSSIKSISTSTSSTYKASTIHYVCLSGCLHNSLVVYLFVCCNMYAYYFRYRNQEEMGQIFKVVSVYHFIKG